MTDDDRMQDAELRARARRLGVAEAERLDVEGVVTGVLGRLRQERRSRRWRLFAWGRGPSGWPRLAAAIVLIVGAGLLVRGAYPERTPALVVEGLQDLSTGQLRQVLATLEQTLETPVPDSGAEDLNDLTTEQLETVLQSLEG